MPGAGESVSNSRERRRPYSPVQPALLSRGPLRPVGTADPSSPGSFPGAVTTASSRRHRPRRLLVDRIARRFVLRLRLCRRHSMGLASGNARVPSTTMAQPARGTR